MRVFLFEKNETILHKLKKYFQFNYYFLLPQTPKSIKIIF
jgi:hypothetical protein